MHNEIGVVVVKVVVVSEDAPDDVVEHLPGAQVVLDLRGSFEDVVRALAPPADAIPGPGLVAQARRNAVERSSFLARYGALSAVEVADLAGSQSSNRGQTAYRWREAGRIFAVTYGDAVLYPAFQFDLEHGSPDPSVSTVLELLPDRLVGWPLAFWWDTPQPLGDRWVSPLDVLDDEEQLARLAVAERERWAADTRRDDVADPPTTASSPTG